MICHDTARGVGRFLRSIKKMFGCQQALKETPARWWGTHKNNITDWVQCRTLDPDEGQQYTEPIRE